MRSRVRARLSPQRLIAVLLAVPAIYLVGAVVAVHFGVGPLHNSIPLRDRLFGGRGNIAFIGSTIPGNPTGDAMLAAGGQGGGYRTADAGPDKRVVKNLDDFFDPQVLRVSPGTTIEFHNDGRNPHTVTADDLSFDSGVLQNGQVWSMTFPTTGVYAYNCKLHGAAGGIGMSGFVLVGDVELPAKDGNGVGPGREPVPTTAGATIHVPADQPTIQAAVDASKPGDLILVAPGDYKEAVLVRTPYITIRGEDRNTTVLDGELKRPNGIHVVEADGVVVENMTAHGYQLNGFYWTSVLGYRGSYLTAYGNGDYGIYAFDSVWGRFDHSYAAGQPDSGFYIGQCYPCHAVITDSISVHNALGYSGTNAGGDLVLVNSEWTGNIAGIAPNTLDSEKLAPQRDITILGNWVHDNNATDVPTKRLEWPTYGIGIVLAGGRGNLVQGNLVEGNNTYGIAVLPNLDDNLWATRDNTVRDNLVRRSGRADLALGAPSVRGDCFSGNTYNTSMPPAIEAAAGCDLRVARGGEPGVTFALLARFAQALGGHYPAGSWETEPVPPAQPQMPGAVDAAPVLAVPETAVPGTYTVKTVEELQAGTSWQTPDPRAREVVILGIPLTGGLMALIGIYGYILPLVLYAAWVAISLWDLVRREELGSGRRYGWMTAVLLIPFLGPILYLLAGRSPIPRGTRLFLVFGALAVYLVILVISFLAEAL